MENRLEIIPAIVLVCECNIERGRACSSCFSWRSCEQRWNV